MTLKKRGLGRGLEALLVDVPTKDDSKEAADATPPLEASFPKAMPEQKQQVPVVIKKMEEQAVMAATLIKNIQQENSNLLKETEFLMSLLDEFELMVRRLEID